MSKSEKSLENYIYFCHVGSTESEALALTINLPISYIFQLLTNYVYNTVIISEFYQRDNNQIDG